MKFNTLFVVGICAGTFLVSCNPKTAQENQLSLTHTSLVDGDAFQFFQIVGSKVVYEKDYAAYAVGEASSSQAKQLAEKAQEVYSSLIPGLDSLAIIKQVDFPVKGAAQYQVSGQAQTAVAHEVAAGNRVDSAAVEVSEAQPVRAAGFADDAYVHHVLHEVTTVKDQIQRMTRNTDVDVRAFAEANLERVTELFKLAGGTEDAHGHH